MNTNSRISAIFVIVLYAQVVSAHEIQTHAKISEAAFDQSAVGNDVNILQNLGLKNSDKFLNSQDPEPRTIKELISDGSRFEDNTESTPRPFNHFFDPLHDKPLTVLGIPLGETSPDWALESSNEIGSQHYSLRDARDYLYQALTAAPKSDRDKNFGLAFQTLGHVIHYLQDLTQPQHVRNGTHAVTVIHTKRRKA